jgi:RNA polymerase sigma factor (sigma-70 family)
MTSRPTTSPVLLHRLFSDAQARFSDRHLLERFAESGDEAAFASILDRHGPMLLGLCRRLLRDSHRADDVVQATFLVLARKARSIRRRDSLAGWLYGVAHRLARKVQRDEAARSRRERRATKERRRPTAVDPGWQELLHILDEELRRLPEAYRTPLLLCYLEGRTQDEAARQLRWSLSTLRRRLETGRELLRGRMIRRGATLGAGLFAGFLAPLAVRAALTPELRQAALNVALATVRGSEVPPALALLADGRGLAIVAKISLFVLVLAMGVGVAGMLSQRRPASEARQTPPPRALPAEPAKKSAERRDRFNDPLPAGAVARAGTVAFRHGRVVWGASLTFTPDGKRLISAGGGWVRRWDLATGHASINLGEGFRDGMVKATLVTADAKLAHIGKFRFTEHDLENGKERTYRIESPRTREDAYGGPRYLSPDGKMFAELSQRGGLFLWNAVKGTFTRYIKPQGVSFTALAFPPDGKTVVVGDDAHNFRILDRATGTELRSFGILNAHKVTKMAISPDGKWLAAVGVEKKADPMPRSLDRFLRLWDLKEGSMVRKIDLPEHQRIDSLLFTPDSRSVIAGMNGGRRCAVRSWDVATGKPGRAWTDYPTFELTLAVSPDGKTLATMNTNGVIRLWDWMTGKEKNQVEASPCALDTVCFRPDGKTLATVGNDLVLREWDATTGRQLSVPRTLLKNGIYSTFLAEGKLLAIHFAKDENTIAFRLFDPATGKLLLEQPGFRPVVTSNGKRMALKGKDHRIRLFDPFTGKVMQTLAPPAEEAKSDWPHPVPRGFMADGQSLILQGETLSIWDLRTGEQKTSWSLRKNRVLEEKRDRERRTWERLYSVVPSPDGNTFAFSLLKDRPDKDRPHDWGGRIMLFETTTGKLLHQIDVDDESFEVIAFSPDGQRLAAGGTWTIRLWDVKSAKSVATFEGHRGKIKSLAFSPDGKRLASASEDSSVLIWDVSK